MLYRGLRVTGYRGEVRLYVRAPRLGVVLCRSMRAAPGSSATSHSSGHRGSNLRAGARAHNTALGEVESKRGDLLGGPLYSQHLRPIVGATLLLDLRQPSQFESAAHPALVLVRPH
jgi:hypothetical protein